MLLLLFAGAGLNLPPPPILKVIGRVAGGDTARASTQSGATYARLSAGDAAQGGLSTGETAGDTTGDSASQGGVTSGEEP